MWSSLHEEVVLVKGEKGLGFFILDYQVCSAPAKKMPRERGVGIDNVPFGEDEAAALPPCSAAISMKAGKKS